MKNNGKEESTNSIFALFHRLQQGIPLVEQPFRALGEEVGLSEHAVLRWVALWKTKGLFRRFGAVVNHHKLGFSRNAMVVFDVSDKEVARIGQRVGQYSFVTLCYCRRRARPWWPYNLYCMIHGKSEDHVRTQVRKIIDEVGLGGTPFDILFSRQKFKQRGANYRVCRPELLTDHPNIEVLR